MNEPSDKQGARLRAAIEATRLNFGLTSVEVEELARTAMSLGVRGICVPAIFLSAAVPVLAGPSATARHDVGNAEQAERPQLVTVANFPTGDHALEAVCVAVRASVTAGADQIDLVVPGALVNGRDWTNLSRFIREVVRVATSEGQRRAAVKAILETAAFEEDLIRGAAEAAVDAGVRWLKTSTGFHPAGGATEAAVYLLRSLVPPGVGVKASGGIRTRAAALAMLDAGADRIGTSAEAAILASEAV